MRKRKGEEVQDTCHYGPNAPVELAPYAHKSVYKPHTELCLQPEKDFRVYPGALIHSEKNQQIEKMKEAISSWANSDQRDVKLCGSHWKTWVH